ncbi:MAG: hypothetical protein GYB65_12535 [Chloroflexi bacterium]|nr:hypothetical protein [Chloroflexota bacterium]
MAEVFVAPTPEAEVMGGPMLGILAGLGEEARPLLEKHGLSEIDPQGWYKMQHYLDVLAEVAGGDVNVLQNLVSVGMHAMDNAQLPPETDTLAKALMNLEMTFQMSHRNAGHGWDVEMVDDRTIVCTSHTPYPDDIEYGVLYAYARLFDSTSGNYVVSYDESTPRKDKGGEFTRFIFELD